MHCNTYQILYRSLENLVLSLLKVTEGEIFKRDTE